MFIVTEKDNQSKYGVVDTQDGIVEYYSKSELIAIANKGIKIYGVNTSKNTISIMNKHEVINNIYNRVRLLAGNFDVTKSFDGIHLRFYKGGDIDILRIPYGVTHLDSSFLNSGIKIKELIIPDTVSYISNDCFVGCSIEKIILPSSLEYIGDNCFWLCIDLKEVIMEKSSIRVLPEGIFTDCVSLRKVVLPDNIVEFKKQCFLRCKSLKNINIPDNLCYIGKECFKECNSLESIHLPDRITLKSNCFDSCKALKEVICDDFYNIESSAFVDCSNLKSISIKGDNIRTLKRYTFNNSGLTEIKLPDNLKSIQSGCFFESCLKTITLPEGLDYLGTDSFNGTNITEINLPKSLKILAQRSLCIDSLKRVIFNGVVENWWTNSILSKEKVIDLIFNCEDIYLPLVKTIGYSQIYRVVLLSNNIASFDIQNLDNISEIVCKNRDVYNYVKALKLSIDVILKEDFVCH